MLTYCRNAVNSQPHTSTSCTSINTAAQADILFDLMHLHLQIERLTYILFALGADRCSSAIPHSESAVKICTEQS